MQLPVAQAAQVAWLALEDDGRLVAMLHQVHVQAVVGDIELAVAEPAVIRRIALIERDREGPVPAQVRACERGPESDRVEFGLASQLLEFLRPQPRLRDELQRRRETALLVQDRFDVRGSSALPFHAHAKPLGSSPTAVRRIHESTYGAAGYQR